MDMQVRVMRRCTRVGQLLHLNPDEWVWKNVKHDRVGKTAITSFDDLRDKAESALLRLQHLPELVRAFFRDPCLSYIK
jgi:hypothetical protein